ncbi:MAG: polyphenol oxidase family protein, partial [Ilumatobacteraceae bacterium]
LAVASKGWFVYCNGRRDLPAFENRIEFRVKLIPYDGDDSWIEIGDDTIEIRCSTRRDGDFHLDGDRAALLHRRTAFAPGLWTQLDEVHGTAVLHVQQPGQHDFEIGDAAVTSCRNALLSVWVGDCAPVVLYAADGALGAAHAGWRGALDGVLQATVAGMPSAPLAAVLGPCIHPCCYEFGAADLEAMEARFGGRVRATTSWGTPALDMREVVRAALGEVGVELDDRSLCTGCHPELFFSHRRRRDLGRQVMTISKRAAR